MPNTIKPTTVPQVALEGPLASVQEVDDVLAMPDVSIDPLTAGLPAGKSFQNVLSHPLTNRNPRRGSCICRTTTREKAGLRKRSHEVPYSRLG
jgi:hypothetical protein